jgi:hypothetical protein
MLLTAAVLGVIFLFTYTLDKQFLTEHAPFTEWVAVSVGGIILVFFGMRNAGSAVSSEIQARTWDFQRTSSLGAWSMTWGKLFGSTSYALFSIAICSLVMLVAASMEFGLLKASKLLLVYLAFVAFALGFAFVTGLSSVARGPDNRQSGGAFISMCGVLLVIAIGAVVGQYRRDINADVYWNGFIFSNYEFLVLSLLVFFAWCLIGAYRLMRIELQSSSIPWVWALFVLFLMVYASGFVSLNTVGTVIGTPLLETKAKLAISSLVALGLLYYTVLNESKSVVDLRRLMALLAQHNYIQALRLTPRWVVTLLLYGSTCLMLAALMVFDASNSWDLVRLQHLGALSLFALRDIGIVLFVGYGPRGRRRPENFALLIILLLYTVVPGIFGVLTAGRSHPVFYPYSSTSSLALIIAPLIQATSVWWSVLVRVRRELARCA